MTDREYFAHSAPPGNPWESLPRHLQRTAGHAREFGAAFGSADWTRLAGLWHDLGKYSEEFQDYLASVSREDLHQGELKGRIDHSTAGAQHAVETFGQEFGLALAYVIAGHHAGLPDWEGDGSLSGLAHRLKKAVPQWASNAPPGLLNRERPSRPSLPDPDPVDRRHGGFRAAFWVRMLYAALCDADFLATEEFMRAHVAGARPSSAWDLESLAKALERYVEAKSRSAPPTPVNAIRTQVFEACRGASVAGPGFFTLQVPTGGGKTLASMAFALDHAVRHGLRRVIVAVPYTTIIEQNAKEYRAAFQECGDDAVLEHHSALDPERETLRSRLQSENWDAPIIVTTNVQLLESLFAARSSRCRKLHRIARSVIVLDEAQALPVDLLKPTLWALRELVEVYGCTVVLCSATQPALEWSSSFPIGVRGSRAIIPEGPEHHLALKRVEVEVLGAVSDAELAAHMRDHNQVLTILNTTAHAARLAERLGREPGHFHLSTRMCPAHRLEVLEALRIRLASKDVCRVVSTQLVEAGVDLDFGVVFRDRCGLDSLVQAAGRCNREGLRERGRVFLFSGEEPPPPGHLRETANVGRELVSLFEDPLSPEAVGQYFRQYYHQRSHAWDQKRVLDAVPTRPLRGIQFREMASRYRLIDEDTRDVLIPWKEAGAAAIDMMRTEEFLDRGKLRRVQRYVVSLRPKVLTRLQSAGGSEEVQGFHLLTDERLYDDLVGLRIEAITGRSQYEDNIL